MRMTIKTNRWLLLLATSLLLVLAGCAEDGVIGDQAGGGGAPPGGDTFATIKADVLAGCGCHDASPAGFNGNVSFQNRGDIVDILSPNCPAFGNGFIVDTVGGSAVSTLHEVASGGGGCSVGGGMTVGAGGAQRIADWIDAGAP